MGAVLSKGGKATLTKTSSQMVLAVGLSWDTPTVPTSDPTWDLDVTAFVCQYDSAGNPKVYNGSDQYMVFYNNLKTPDGAVYHSGDERSGAAAGDDETIMIETSKLPADVAEIPIIVTIHEGLALRRTFGQVRNPKIRIYDASNGNELMSYELDEDYSGDVSVQFGSIYKRGDEWKFNAVGAGFEDRELGDFCAYFGVPVA